jgi:DNA polymerase elongation subunit (family B)
MSECLQVEIDPLKISDEYLNGVLVAVDVLPFSPDEYPSGADQPVCLIAAAHTTGLSSISKAYMKLFVAATASELEEGLVLKGFLSYIDTFDGGTVAAHYGATDAIEEGFDLPYLLLRARDYHPEIYPLLRHTLLKFRKHDTCLYVKDRMNVPSADLDYVEGYYGLPRVDESRVEDVRAALAAYWRAGDRTVIKYAIANAYNTLRIAQSQIRKSICCTDISL